MLTLEQVRAVNDGLSRGDWNAALLPLEEQIDLRHAELPKLEKPALTTLKKGLQDPECAAFWAATVFAPNISVRRFARKTLLGLKGEAMPVAAPLQTRLEEFWASETPLPFANTSREAAARREQFEIVQNAIEILLRAEPKRFMTFWAQLVEAAKPGKLRRIEENEAWRVDQQAYSVAFNKATQELVVERLGEEYRDSQKLFQLPSRIWREIHEEAQKQPEVQQLLAKLGNNPWASAAQEWHPENLFTTALFPYMAQNASGPQKEVAEQVRTQTKLWLDEVFEFGDSWPTLHQKELGGQLVPIVAHIKFDNETIWDQFTTWLEGARPALLEKLEENLAINAYGHRKEELEGLWLTLADKLIQSLSRRYNLQKNEEIVPASLSPERLLAIKVGKSDDRWNFASRFDEVAKQLEIAQRPEAKEEVDETAAAELEILRNFTQSTIHLGYSPQEWALATQEAEKLGESVPTVMGRWRQKIRNEVEAYRTLQERSGALLAPPTYIDTLVPRFAMWQVWEQVTAGESLASHLWPLVGEKMWNLYEEKLEAYRRVETDEIPPKLGEILNEKELKAWKSSQRSQKRTLIQAEIDDIASLLRHIEGFEADLKILKLLTRPGVRDIMKRHQLQLLSQAGDAYFNANATSQANAKDPQWLRQHWFLDAKWIPLVEELDTALHNNKQLNDWGKINVDRQLATAYYRLNTPNGREKFLEMAPTVSNLAPQMHLPVTTLGDTESWLLLVSTLEYSFPQMRELWEQTRRSSPQEGEKLGTSILEMLSTTTNEKSAKFQIELADELTPAELSQNSPLVVAALESSLVIVKRWALKSLPLLEADFDQENAAQLAAEMLWNENGALVKDAIKFLGTQKVEAAEIAWDSLQDALTLENQPTLELVLRALANLKSKNTELSLNESAQERLNELAEAAPTRFAKFTKRLA